MSFLDRILGKNKDNTSNQKNKQPENNNQKSVETPSKQINTKEMSDQELFDAIFKSKDSVKDSEFSVGEIVNMVHKIKDESYLKKLEGIRFVGDNQRNISKAIIHRITDEQYLADLIISTGPEYEIVRQLGDEESIEKVVNNIEDSDYRSFLIDNGLMRAQDKIKEIPSSEASRELNNLENRFFGNGRIKRAIDMKKSIDAWSNDMKAFYYYLIAEAIKYKSKYDERQYAFYAAQIYCNPASTSMGWLFIKNLDELSNIEISQKTAEMLHEKFPLPNSFEELL